MVLNDIPAAAAGIVDLWPILNCKPRAKFLGFGSKIAFAHLLCIKQEALRPTYTGRLPADLSPATQMNMRKNSVKL